MYGKPVLPATGGQQSVTADSTLNCCGSEGNGVDGSRLVKANGAEGEPAERATPRPLSPTKLLPFLSNPHRNPSDLDLEALRRRLHHAPRPLKKRSSITEPEGPAGPHIQKLLYQRTTLAAMETVVPAAAQEARTGGSDVTFGLDDSHPLAERPEDSLTPPPLPPRSPIPEPASCRSLPPPLENKEEEEGEVCSSPSTPQQYFVEDFPPYPPPPYPTCGEGEQGDDAVNLQAPEVTGQVAAPPVSAAISGCTRYERVTWW